VSAWGSGIFSDDTACDVRSDYRALLEDGVPDDEAAQRIIESCSTLDNDEQAVMWLALAATQSSLGRLDDAVKRRALQVIDSGAGLQPWEQAGAKELNRRRQALATLRDQLAGPQPPRKVLRRPWRHETDLRVGDVLSYALPSGDVALLRVHRVDDQRVGAAPILSWLDWSGTSLPEASALARLTGRPLSGPGPQGSLETFRVALYRKKDPDWSDVGFSLVAHVPDTPQDASADAVTYVSWAQLADYLDERGAPMS
jgi:hypothetical protein